jgi:hypothetical protein
MEDVLAVYTRPHDPERVLVCLDETSKQLIAETCLPIPMKPGQAARIDYEYERNGTANLFMLFAPLEGWRHIKVTDRHTAIDYAHVLKDLADVHFPHKTAIVLVQDNLNIHSKASLMPQLSCETRPHAYPFNAPLLVLCFSMTPLSLTAAELAHGCCSYATGIEPHPLRARRCCIGRAWHVGGRRYQIVRWHCSGNS